MDTELEKCEAEMGDSSDNGEEEEPHALLNWKKTILKKKELYVCLILILFAISC